MDEEALNTSVRKSLKKLGVTANPLQSSDVVTSFGLFSCGFGGANTRSVRRRSSK
jgi:hypothetical protein